MTNIHDGEPWESSPQITGKIKWEVIAPIDTEEIRMTLCSMKRTSVGMDKLSTQEVLTWHLPSLAGLMNIILATERLPSHLAMARVTFLPKVESPADPGDFRPTAISSVLARTLHKILLRRMREQFEFSPLQNAFLQRKTDTWRPKRCFMQYCGTPMRKLNPGIADTQRYLGVHFTWKGRITTKQTKEVERMLQEITSAPLKPYQRVEIVQDFMVPKLQHELVLGCAHRNTISRIERMILRSFRAWLRLPNDTSLGFLHAPRKSGGLGIPSLVTTLPLL